MKLSYKIFLYFGTFMILVILIFFSLNYYVIQGSLHQRAKKDLLQIVESANTAVENMLNTAIQNYLRGIVEQDIAFLRHLLDQVQSGRMSEQQAKDIFQEHVSKQKIGDSGYIVALKPVGANIMLDIHPFLRGEDCSSNQGCQDWISQKKGYNEYDWQNPEDKTKKKKVSYIMHFEPWDWVVGATSYKDEFTQLVNIEDLDQFISSYTILDRGYFFVVDDELMFLIHPELKGKSGRDIQDLDSQFITREILENPESFIYYNWKNPSETKSRKKFAYSKKFENFNWYLVATGYSEDVTRPINKLMRLSYGLISLMSFSLIGLIIFFSRSLSQPLNELINGLQSFYNDKQEFKMDSRSVAEIEAVGHSIETMTKTILDSEKEKKDLLDLLDSIINSMPSILICIDNTEKIIIWNDKATEYSGFSREQALQHKMVEIFPEFKEILDNMKEILKSKDHYSDTCQIQNKTREDLHFAITIYPLYSGLQSAVIRIDDITEQTHIKEMLLQSHKMESIGTLAGGIAHDFNNILSAIMGYAELSQSIVSKDEKAFDYQDKILTAGHRARDLVQQILTFSRQNKQEFKPLLVNSIVKEALKLLKASTPSTISIQEKIESNALITGDATQIHQVLMNLCTNANHAMQKEGGILKVTLTDMLPDSGFISLYPELKSNPHIHLTISDSGCGMPQEVLERIFDPFFTTKGKFEGTGMGLAVVHGIVKGLNGIIDVKSKPDKGSEFNIFLPVAESDLEIIKKTDGPIPKGFERILFVDDELPIVEIGKQTLENLGYKVVIQTSAVEALELFKLQPEEFDLVVTDMTMPQMTGKTLAKEMLLIRKEIPILLCTGFSSGVTEEKTKKIGIKGFLMKPIVMKDLAQKIREALDSVKGITQQ